MSKKNISASLKASVWNKYIGEEIGIGKCFCCGLATITKDNFDCGHIQAEIKGGGTNLGNLRPICGKCNSSMGTKNMEDFMYETGYDKNRNWNGIQNLELDKLNEKIKKKREKLKEISKELKSKEEELNMKETIFKNIKNYIEKKLGEIKDDIKVNFLFSKIEECKINNKSIDKMKYFFILNEIINKINNPEEIRKIIDDKKIKINYVNGECKHMDANKTMEAIQKLCEIFKIKFYVKIRLINDEIYEWKN